jgi:MFS family permease
VIAEHSRARHIGLTVVAVVFAVLFVGAILPTPLYPLYRHAFGFGGLTLTLIYAAYVLGNLTVLLFFGRLSDQVGRRVVTLSALAIGLASTLVFLCADGTAWLYGGRVLSGLATGIGAGAATAWIAELYPRGDRAAAAALASAANFAGCALAPLLAGVLAQVAPAPLRLPYAAYTVLLMVTAAAVLTVPETAAHRARLADVALQPRVGVPPQIRLAFVAPAVTAFASFALLGFYAALIPSLLGESLHLGLGAPFIAGAVVCELFGVAAATAALTASMSDRAAMFGGLALLPPSLALLVVAQLLQSLALLLVAAALGGIAAALGYRGSLGVVNRIAPDDRRSEVVSSYLIAVYCGNSLPVIGIGVLSMATSAATAHLVFAVLTALLAVAAWMVGRRFDQPGR